MNKILSLVLSVAMVIGLVPMMTISSSAAYSGKLTFDENGEFTIIQFTDIQDDKEVHEDALEMITKSISRYSPDLVVLTGDNIAGGMNESDFQSSVNQFMAPVINAGVPYAVTFGNHDDEDGTLVTSPTRDEQYDYYIGMSDLAIDFDVDSLSHTGTGSIPIYSNDGSTVKFAVFPIDTGGYDENGDYDHAKTDQVEWYEAEANRLGVPHLVFQHIIVPEIYTTLLVEAASTTSGAVKGGSGSWTDRYWVLDPNNSSITGELKEGPCPSEQNGGQYAAMVRTGTMVGNFVGHDHTNNFVGTTADGITIGYTQALTMHSYGTHDPAVRVFHVKEDGTYTTEHIALSEMGMESGGDYEHDVIAGTPTVPSRLVVGASGNGLSQQKLGNVIQTTTVNHRTQALYPNDMNIEIDLASELVNVTLDPQSGINVSGPTVTDNPDGTTKKYQWTITGGTATAGTAAEYKFTYENADGAQFTQYAYSYVDDIRTPAGYYVNTRNFSGNRYSDLSINTPYWTNQTYVMTVLGDTAYGDARAQTDDVKIGYDNAEVPGWTTATAGYYNYTGQDDSGFIAMGDADYGLIYTSPSREKCRNQPNFERFKAAGKSPVTTVYVDSSVHSTMADLNLRVNYWRHSVPSKGSTGSIAFNLHFFNDDVGYSADTLGSQNADTENIRADVSSTTLSSPRGSNTYISISGQLPADGAKYTVVSRGYSHNSTGSMDHNTYLPALITFVTYDKTELKALVNAERTAMRQTDDVLYRSAFKEAYKQVMKINTTQADINAAITLLNSAIAGLNFDGIDISDNGAYAGTATVPPVVYIAGANYGIAQQPEGTTLQKGIVDYALDAIDETSSKFYFTVPDGASDASVTITESNGNSVDSNWDRATGEGQITGGTSSEGAYLIYKFTYTLNGKTYEQIEASAVLPAPQAAGWTSYAFVSADGDRSRVRAILETAILFGHGGAMFPAGVYYNAEDAYSGANYGINLDASSNNNFAGYGYQKVGGIGMAFWESTEGRHMDTLNDWFNGDNGKDSPSDIWSNPGRDDGSRRAKLNVAIDKSVISNINQTNLGLRYISLQNKASYTDGYALMQITKQGFYSGAATMTTVEAAAGAGNTSELSLSALPTASYGVKAGGVRDVIQSLSAANGLPAAGTYTFHTEVYNVQTHTEFFGTVKYTNEIYGHYMFNLNFSYVDKTAIRSFVAEEDENFRQLGDGYDDSDGSFTAYQNALAKAKAAVTDVTLTDTETAEIQTALQAAIANLKYLPADFTELDKKIAEVSKMVDGVRYFRPHINNDPTYYATGEYYPQDCFSSYNELDIPIIESYEPEFRALDFRYQNKIDQMVEAIDVGWINVRLVNADYTNVDYYLAFKEGTGENGAAGGATIVAPNKYDYLMLTNPRIPAEKYTTDSYNAWTNACAIGQSDRSRKKPDQDIVDGYALNLETAYNNLTLRPADYAPVEAVMAAAQESLNMKVEVVDPSNAENNFFISWYNDELIAQFNEMYNAVDRTLTIVENDKVQAYADELDVVLAQIYETLNDVDLTFANEQKNTKATYEDEYEKYYTAESWQKLVTAREKVNDKLASRTAERQESEVNAIAKEIYDARNALVYNKANYDKVNEFLALIAAAEANKDWYKNWNVAEEAVAAVVPDLDMPEQERVTKMGDDLETAYNSLELKDASYEDLKAALDLAVEKNEDAEYYTDDTYAGFQSAYQAANKVYTDGQTAPLTIDKQDVVDAAEDDLLEAIGNLKYKDANMTALFEAMAQYEETVYGGMYNGEYPDTDNDGNEDILDNVNAAYAVAAQLKADYEDGKLTAKDNKTIATAANTLASLRAALPASYLYVYEAVADPYSGEPLYDYKTDGKLSAYLPTLEAELKKLYTDESVKNVIDTLEDINYNLKIDDQTIVDELSGTVSEAMYMLEYKPADLTKLLEAMAAGDEKVAKAESPDWFTDDTWAAYEEAYNEALNIRDADPAYNASEQEAVDAAANELANAAAALAYKDADYDELNTAISTAKGLTASEWTPETWADVEVALAEAEAVQPGLKIDSQADINTKAQALVAAIEALKSGTLELVGLEWTDMNTMETKKTIIDNERGFIYGLIDVDMGGPITDLVSQGYAEVVGNGYLKYTPVGNNSNLGTGAKVELIRGTDDGDDTNNEVVKTYYIVIFGDNDGDGYVTVDDSTKLLFYYGFEFDYAVYDFEDLTIPQVFAMDINADGWADIADLQFVFEHVAFMRLDVGGIDQSYTAQPEIEY